MTSPTGAPAAFGWYRKRAASAFAGGYFSTRSFGNPPDSIAARALQQIRDATSTTRQSRSRTRHREAPRSPTYSTACAEERLIHALFERIDVLGVEEVRIHPTQEAQQYGWLRPGEARRCVYRLTLSPCVMVGGGVLNPL